MRGACGALSGSGARRFLATVSNKKVRIYIYIYEPRAVGVYLTTCFSFPYESLIFFLYTLTYTTVPCFHSRANSFTQRWK